MRNKKHIFFRVIFLIIFIYISYPILALENKKITVVPRGYTITGIDFEKAKEFNALLEATLANFDTFSFLELQNASPNEILREPGKQKTPFEQRFDYTVSGWIVKTGDVYQINTSLINNKTTQNFKLYDDNVIVIEDAIREHGKALVEFIRNLQLDVTIESILNAERDRDLNAARTRLNLYRFQYGDSTELQDIERRLGRSPTPDTDTIEALIQINAIIDLLLNNSIKDRKERERLFYRCNSSLKSINETELLKYDNIVQEIKIKLDRYEKRYIREINLGGIETSYFKPVLFNDLLGGNILDYYPDIFGMSISWLIPGNSETFRTYIKLIYLGFDNHALYKADYLDIAAIYGISSVFGFQYQWILLKYIFPYIYSGLGYSHFIEYAEDNISSAVLHYGNMYIEAGLGIKIYTPLNLVIFANTGLDLYTGGIIGVAVNYSFGVGYSFYSRKKIYN